MSGKDLVSVIVPVYNRAKLIVDTLNSVKAQTYRPLELIIVDNGSRDESRALCRDFSLRENAPDFDISIAVETRKGASAARNAGMRLAHGKWIAFFDSDDIMSSSFIETMLAAASMNTSVVIAPTAIWYGEKDCVAKSRIFLADADPASQIMTSEISTQSFVARRDFIVSIGGWNEKLPRWNDWELGVRMLLARPQIRWIRDRAFHKIRAHADSITGTNFSSSCSDLILAMGQVRDDIFEADFDIRRLTSALALRAYLLAGKMAYERDDCSSRQVEDFAFGLSESSILRFFGSLLMNLTSLGVRGLWRLGLFISRFA